VSALHNSNKLRISLPRSGR